LIEKSLQELQKSFGTDKIYLGSEEPDVEVVSTGSVSLDFATGVGGLPRGTIVEVFGPESIGKTTLSYYMIAEAQKAGLNAGFVNLEGLFNAAWAKRVAGVDLDKLIVASPDPGTEAIQVAAKMVLSGSLGLVVFDSIGAMLGDKEQDANNAKQAGGQSALVTHMVKMLMIPARRHNCTVVFLNQVRDVFSHIPGLTESPGGHAAKHAAVMRIQLKPTRDKFEEVVNGEKIQVGYRVAAFIKKNKVAAPKQTANYSFFTHEVNGYPLGIDRNQEVIDLAFKYGIIEQSGSYYLHPTFPKFESGKYEGQNAIYKRSEVDEFIKANPEALEQMRMELMKLAGKQPEGHETLL
jgi:recombination protein RecA